MLRASRRVRVMGQEPTGGDPAVVVPPVTPENPAAVEPQTPENPVVPSPETPATPEPKVFDEAYVRTLRAENADWRTKYQDAKNKLDEIDRANMTELDRIKADLTKATAETIPGLLAQNRALQVESAAVKMGIVDPEVAAKFIDWTKIDGGSTVEAELVSLLEAKPYLKAQPTQAAPTQVAPTQPTPTAPVSQSNPANPSAHQGKKTYTQSQLNAMSVAQVQAEMADIQYALANGLVDKTR